MALKFKQYRYFGVDNAKNKDITLVNGQMNFVDWPSNIKRIGI